MIRRTRGKLVKVWFRQEWPNAKTSFVFPWQVLGRYKHEHAAVTAMKKHAKKWAKEGARFRYKMEFNYGTVHQGGEGSS